MAEVSLRLFRGRSWQRSVKGGVRGKGCTGSLVWSCTSCRGNAGYPPQDRHKLLLKTLWPSGATTSNSVWVSREPVIKVRQWLLFFSGWSSSRAFSDQKGGRRHGPGNDNSELVHPLYRSRTAYYDILEVSGKATQAQIKSAYYKQSFRFHPDRNSGDKASSRQFGLVTEAYHVLGSISLRKKYDRGTLSLKDVQMAKKPNGKGGTSTSKGATGQREASSTSTNTSPTTPMFDFDAFYQAHYGEQLAREQSWKARREHMEKIKEEKRMSQRQNRMNEFSALVLFITATILLVTCRS
ncbi:dnaJ homolog subfamily C member 30, mitochondrial [Pseudophryne corroboree]|uniref:dnaJ homolog subfamily C member 30, mitochondrial n=1 Tax=Pseudophryne corroboree TaxID=495146 RepID=UPI003081C0DC